MQDTDLLNLSELRLAAEQVSRSILKGSRNGAPKGDLLSLPPSQQEIIRNDGDSVITFDWKVIETASDNDFIAYCYNILLGRSVDEVGQKAWIDSLGAGTKRGTVLEVLQGSEEFLARGCVIKEVNSTRYSSLWRHRLVRACAPSLTNLQTILNLLVRRRVV